PTVDLIFNDAEFKSSYLCLPKENEELKGKYKVWFNVTLKNMITTSRLQRAFVGDKTAEGIDKLRREEISRVITTPQSLAPADFAHINFDIGHAAKEIVIESKDYKTIVVKGNIENTGSGKIVAVKRYEINLESEGFSVQQNNAGGNTCLQGEFVSIPSTSYTKTIPLPTCIVTGYPEELKTTSYWVPKTFTATLLYDYRITKDADIDIKPAEDVVG
ncbi:MAG: hypothetical protein Q7K45_04175, partial [Nanoarchaeota archaeon]|nr:hypothetical protein [Nanoarchaeota archaeon]